MTPAASAVILDPMNANMPQIRLVDMATGESRWKTPIQLGSVHANIQYYQHLYQLGQAQTAFLPNAEPSRPAAASSNG